MCNVGAIPTAHLLYANGARMVSLLSLPADRFPELIGDVEFESDGRPIVGFTRGQSLYCLVGSSTAEPVTVADLRALRDRLRDTVALRRHVRLPAPTFARLD